MNFNSIWICDYLVQSAKFIQIQSDFVKIPADLRSGRNSNCKIHFNWIWLCNNSHFKIHSNSIWLCNNSIWLCNNSIWSCKNSIQTARFISIQSGFATIQFKLQNSFQSNLALQQFNSNFKIHSNSIWLCNNSIWLYNNSI